MLRRDRKRDNLPRWTIDATEKDIFTTDQIDDSALPVHGSQTSRVGRKKRLAAHKKTIAPVPKDATLKDLCPTDKRRIAELITELASATELKELAAQHLQEERTAFESQLKSLHLQLQTLLKSRQELDDEHRQSLDLLQRYRNQLLTQEGALSELRCQYALQTTKMPQAFTPTDQHMYSSDRHFSPSHCFHHNTLQPLVPEPDWAEVPAYIHSSGNSHLTDHPFLAVSPHLGGTDHTQVNGAVLQTASRVRSNHDRKAAPRQEYGRKSLLAQGRGVPCPLCTHRHSSHCTHEGDQLYERRKEHHLGPTHGKVGQERAAHRHCRHQPSAKPDEYYIEASSNLSTDYKHQSGNPAEEWPMLPDQVTIPFVREMRHSAAEIPQDIPHNQQTSRSSSSVESNASPSPQPTDSPEVPSRPSTVSSQSTNKQSVASTQHVTGPPAHVRVVDGSPTGDISLSTSQRCPVGPDAAQSTAGVTKKHATLSTQAATSNCPPLLYSGQEDISLSSSVKLNHQSFPKSSKGNNSERTNPQQTRLPSTNAPQDIATSTNAPRLVEIVGTESTAKQQSRGSSNIHPASAFVNSKEAQALLTAQERSGQNVTDATTLLAWPKYGSVGSLQSGKVPLARSSPEPKQSQNANAHAPAPPAVDEDSLIASMMLNDCPSRWDAGRDDKSGTVGGECTGDLPSGGSLHNSMAEESTSELWGDNLLDVLSQLENTPPLVKKRSPNRHRSMAPRSHRQGCVAHVLRCSQRIHKEDSILGDLFFHV